MLMNTATSMDCGRNKFCDMKNQKYNILLLMKREHPGLTSQGCFLFRLRISKESSSNQKKAYQKHSNYVMINRIRYYSSGDSHET